MTQIKQDIAPNPGHLPSAICHLLFAAFDPAYFPQSARSAAAFVSSTFWSFQDGPNTARATALAWARGHQIVGRSQQIGHHGMQLLGIAHAARRFVVDRDGRPAHAGGFRLDYHAQVARIAHEGQRRHGGQHRRRAPRPEPMRTLASTRR